MLTSYNRKNTYYEYVEKHTPSIQPKYDNDQKIVIMTTLYNAEKYIKRCIDSMKIQTENFICYITNDLSTDNSQSIVENEIFGDSRFILINNKSKMYQPGNYYQISQINSLSNESNVVTLDGDDWFPDNNVLTRVKSYYSNRILMAFGQFAEYYNEQDPLGKGFTARPSNPSDIRRLVWSTSHLRTFKLGLFREINRNDLIAPSGNFWECTGDMAIIFPMVEMCNPNLLHFTNDINMIYNSENPINDSKANRNRQREYDVLIRSKPKYHQLFD
jgi:glycosyltransferase involved in cell wall biosynthesis